MNNSSSSSKRSLASKLASLNRQSPQRYSIIGEEALEDSGDLSDPSGPIFLEKPHFSLFSLLPWALSLIFASLSLIIFLRPYPPCSTYSYERGWETDFAPVREAISTRHVRYTGGPDFDDRNHMIVPHPDPIKYIGDPSPEIDEAWEKLTSNRYFLISEDEAQETFGEDYASYWNDQVNGYEIGLDMFHTLHCLNNLRKLMHPEYYPQSRHPHAIIHNDHCIEQLRQQVMCAGDMTPVPVKLHKPLSKSYVASDTLHTCRDFGKLRDWMVGRFYVGGNTTLQDIIRSQ